MSLKALMASSSCTIEAGARFAMMSQKIHAMVSLALTNACYLYLPAPPWRGRTGVVCSVTPLPPIPTLARLCRRLLLPFEQDLHDLRHDRAGALVQLVVREVGDRMLHAQVFIIGQAPGLGHRPAGRVKHIGDNRGRWNAVLFKQNTVEHTARAARASIADPGDDDIAVGSVFIDDLLVRRYPGAMLAAHNVALSTVFLLQNRGNTEQQLIRIVLRILDQANTHVAQRFWPGHEGNGLFLRLRGRIEHL